MIPTLSENQFIVFFPVPQVLQLVRQDGHVIYSAPDDEELLQSLLPDIKDLLEKLPKDKIFILDRQEKSMIEITDSTTIEEVVEFTRQFSQQMDEQMRDLINNPL